jgi:folate-binding protein YgfZ
VVSVQGPGAPAILATVAGHALDLAPHAHVEATLAGAAARVVQRAEFGALPGYFIWTAPPHAGDIQAALRAAGAVPVDHDVAEILRVEAGVPAYGQDVDESVLLPETGLEQMVSYTKGCYIGQELVARVKYRGHVNRALTGLRLEGERVPAPGAVVVAGDREIGRITSAARSLGLGVPIALGYVRREHREPGESVTVRLGDDLAPARVAALPFI